MKNTLSTILSIFIATTLFSSCDNDPDNLYGKKKEMQILDESGNTTTTAYASIYPTLFKFTDTKNPERYFITGSGRSSANIKYNFN